MVHMPITLGLIAALAIGGAAAAGGSGPDNAQAGLACGVSTQKSGGMLTLEGVLQSSEALNGDYRFALRSSGGGGSSTINQGGPFSAAPGLPVSLGKVTVNAGSKVDVDFSITSGGKKYDCSQQFAATT